METVKDELPEAAVEDKYVLRVSKSGPKNIGNSDFVFDFVAHEKLYCTTLNRSGKRGSF